MITTYFLKIVIWIALGIIGLLPSSSGFPEEVHEATQTVGGYLNILDPLVPLDTLHITVGIVLIAEIALWSFFLARWVWKRIPFLGS